MAKSTHITCNANFTGAWSQDDNTRASMLFNLNCITAGSEAFNIISIAAGSVTPLTRFVVSATGNVGIGTSTFGTNAVSVLAIRNGTVPASSPADSVQLYAEDVAASSELKVRDEAGNITTLSPHAKDAPDWLYDEEDLQPPHITREANVYSGRIRFVNHTRTARLQQTLFNTGPLPKDPLKRKTIHEETFDEYNKRHGLKPGDSGYLVKEDWEGNQELNYQQREDERAEWRARKAEHAQAKKDFPKLKKAHEAKVKEREKKMELWDALPAEIKAATERPQPLEPLPEVGEFTEPEPERYVKKPKPDFIGD